MQELECYHEEANTRLLLHAHHASTHNSSEILLVCEDTNVLVLTIAFCSQIRVPINQKKGSQSRSRVVDIRQIKDAFSEEIAHTLPGLHPFTGCDTVPAFAGKGKLTALKIMKDSPKFQRAFTLLGERFDVTNELLTTLEEFVCRLYGSQTVKTYLTCWRIVICHLLC